MWKTLMALLTFGIVAAGCSQPLTTREKGALGGAGLGAAAGAIIGHAVGSPGAGAAIGGALGGVTGAVAGDRLQKRDTEMVATQARIERQRAEIARNRQLLDELRQRNLEARETERGVVVNLPDVLFEFGRSTLTGGAAGRVQDIADVLNTQAAERRVSVEGHTDAIGGEDANQRLSEAPRPQRSRCPVGFRRRGKPSVHHGIRRALSGRAEHEPGRLGQRRGPRPEPPRRSRHRKLAFPHPPFCPGGRGPRT